MIKKIQLENEKFYYFFIKNGFRTIKKISFKLLKN